MAQTCYRHPDRLTGVACSNCGRPICPECMTPTPVGMRCPECAAQRTRVTYGQAAFAAATPATYALIALNVVAFLATIATGSGGLDSSAGTVIDDFSLRGIDVADGEWYRVLTGGFLHAGFIHLGFNMFALYVLGRLLEPAIGTPRFVALYFASLFAGAFGALLLADPATTTVGASGAVFGLFGAAFVIARGRGFDTLASELGFLLLINLAFTFAIPFISVGGHLGGLAGGFLCALMIVAGERRRGAGGQAVELLAMAALGAACAVAAVAVA